MLHVEYKLDKDEYGGIGLFANQFIKKGQLVFTYNREFVQIITEHDIDSMSRASAAAFRKFCYSGKGKYKLNGAFYYDIDDSRFMNHSLTPSLTHVAEDNSYIASHDIIPGEEITCDYTEIDDKELSF